MSILLLLTSMQAIDSQYSHLENEPDKTEVVENVDIPVLIHAEVRSVNSTHLELEFAINDHILPQITTLTYFLTGQHGEHMANSSGEVTVPHPSRANLTTYHWIQEDWPKFIEIGFIRAELFEGRAIFFDQENGAIFTTTVAENDGGYDNTYEDETAPKLLEFNITDHEITSDENTTITANFSDHSGILSAEVRLLQDNGKFIRLKMHHNSTAKLYQATFSPRNQYRSSNFDIHLFRIVDNAGNSNYPRNFEGNRSIHISDFVNDTSAPALNSVSYTRNETHIHVTANASDTISGISSVETRISVIRENLEYTPIKGVKLQFNKSSQLYEADVAITCQYNCIEIKFDRFELTDHAGNSNRTNDGSFLSVFELESGTIDNNAPELQSIFMPEKISYNDTLKISIKVNETISPDNIRCLILLDSIDVIGGSLYARALYNSSTNMCELEYNLLSLSLTFGKTDYFIRILRLWDGADNKRKLFNETDFTSPHLKITYPEEWITIQTIVYSTITSTASGSSTTQASKQSSSGTTESTTSSELRTETPPLQRLSLALSVTGLSLTSLMLLTRYKRSRVSVDRFTK